MDLHEHQAKRLLAAYGLPVPIGEVATSVDRAGQAARRLGCSEFVVKAQVLAGDRKAGGGIRFASTPAEVEDAARKLLGSRLVTRQTGARGADVSAVHVEERITVARNLYVAITLDKLSGTIVMLASAKGGDDIEERAADGDTIIARLPLRIEGTRIVGNFEAFAARIAGEERLAAGLATVLGNLAAAFLGCDATLIEINPLAVTDRGRLCALDAKVTIDDNALFRRADLADLKTHNVDVAADASEREAQSFQINYMKLEGEIGCVVNGAGLALATHDLVVDAGGRPANFMDIRTTASSLDIAKGLGLLLQNRSVRSLLVNVHGGGMQRCDTIAEGIGIAMRRAGRSLPIVIRMAGNNARFAETVLRNNGVVYTSVDDMAEAARIAVEAARQEAA
ncbi:MAG: ADP-forming succinate--CoA ligase subunit beta [Hyphomicrobiaceae bacterium]|nr:ADP-forming succinate--CoA ligase subunit beta [Hyphomicrobiaceae bacterium]